LIVGFDANLDRLIQLYIIGVFTSFTLSQLGMVRHWQRALRERSGSEHLTGANQHHPVGTVRGGLGATERRTIRRSQVINATGALFTAVVLVVVFATKVVHGAWLAVLAMLGLFVAMRGINRYYRRVTAEVIPLPSDPPITLPGRVHAVVLVSRLHKPALRALALARAIRPAAVTAVTLNIDDEETRVLRREWDQHAVPVRLMVLEAPYRDPHRPLLGYVRQLGKADPSGVVMVFLPEYLVTHWWQHVLHNQSALRFKARLLFTPGVVVVDVPYHLGIGDQGWLGNPRRPVHPDEQRADHRAASGS
jgi:hypothetical protein